MRASPGRGAAVDTAVPTSADDATRLCEAVVLDVRAGHEPTPAPPVRIFLGTESAQLRAERIFIYSVDKHRDPGRVYEIYRMKDLPGFDRSRWRTGFTHYRFAIPELAGGTGRAIYNDVDQIYCEDPARLFDRGMDGHGVLSISPDDTSVMLIDCERMLHWWNLGRARGATKRELTAAPVREPGLWGPLEERWNARDLEFRPGQGGLLHYTHLHLQPWRPAPEQYSYHPHPLGEVWFALEREADDCGFHPFTARRPSRAYRLRQEAADGAAGVEAVPAVWRAALAFLERQGEPAPTLVTWRNGGAAQWPGAVVELAARAPAAAPLEANAIAAVGLLEAVPEEDVGWLLDALFAGAGTALALRIDVDRSARADEHWWREQARRAAERQPGRCWQLTLVSNGRARHYASTWAARREPPRVWVLMGRHGGDNAQLTALAEAVGWPWEARHLAFNALYLLPAWALGESVHSVRRECRAALSPPWPDLVIACGRRSQAVARWIRARSGGATRLVQLGRPRAPLAAFDLIVTTPQYRLPARDNIVHLTGALNRRSEAELAAAASEWEHTLAALPRPWYALVVGGNRWPYVLDRAAARRIGERASALAAARGGALLVTSSARTPAAARAALLDAVTVPFHASGAGGEDEPNPYPAYLALADAFVVTADSASMLAETAATGKPVWIADVPRRTDSPWSLRGWVARALERYRSRAGERGTPRQQNAVDRAVDRLVDAGLFTPTRDMARYHEAFVRAGRAAWLGDPAPGGDPFPGRDLGEAAAAVARVMRAPAPVGPWEQE